MPALPVVFVHGIRVTGAVRSAPAAQVRVRHPVATPDLPGHGGRRGQRFTLDDAVAVVAESIEQLGGRALVVGHSLGGYVAIATAARHSKHVAGLMITGASCVPNPALTIPFTAMHRVLSWLPDGGDRLSRQLFTHALPPTAAESVVAGGIATEVIPDVMAQMRRFDPLTNLRSFPGPVWLINGGHDHFRAHENRFLSACRDGRLLTVPGAGHALPLTHPTQFTRLVLDAATATDATHRTPDAATTDLGGTDVRAVPLT